MLDPIRLVIATDIRLYREGLADILVRHAGVTVVGTIADTSLPPEQACTGNPQVLLLDMAMSGSRSFALACAEALPRLRIVAITVSQTERVVLDCAEVGVAGYVLREASVEDLVAAIKSAVLGELWCPPGIADILRQRLTGRGEPPEAWATVDSLTRREREIVPLIDQGLDNKSIARTLGIEVATVKNHVHNILEKLQVQRRGQAAARLGGRLPWRTTRVSG